MNTTIRTVSATALTILASAAVLAGCSDDSDGPDTSSVTTSAATISASPSSGAAVAGEHNDADVRFAQDMIGHHNQAVQMAALAPGRSTDQAVLELAVRIQQAQGPEVTTMTGWLQTWGSATATVTATATSMPGMGHGATPMPSMGHSAMPGMMSLEQMSRLAGVGGTDFDRMWLTMMIEHHQGAIEMARTELAQGANPDAKKLAQKIIDDQQTEITQMQAMLAQR
ncbi:DUF305 domain-containing protein [Nocardia sp. NPDC005366]|uniref:DUF305 domain-containing protein n=1 Tax=Nocardia sp. NPDC005366 TaxID=3156878 RepID=UPI0033B5A1B1